MEFDVFREHHHNEGDTTFDVLKIISLKDTTILAESQPTLSTELILLEYDGLEYVADINGNILVTLDSIKNKFKK